MLHCTTDCHGHLGSALAQYEARHLASRDCRIRDRARVRVLSGSSVPPPKSRVLADTRWTGENEFVLVLQSTVLGRRHSGYCLPCCCWYVFTTAGHSNRQATAQGGVGDSNSHRCSACACTHPERHRP